MIASYPIASYPIAGDTAEDTPGAVTGTATGNGGGIASVVAIRIVHGNALGDGGGILIELAEPVPPPSGPNMRFGALDVVGAKFGDLDVSNLSLGDLTV